MRLGGMLIPLFLVTCSATANENRLIFGASVNRLTVGAFGHHESFAWDEKAVEIEMDLGNERSFISGLGVGFRKSGPRLNEGAYLTVRVFKRLDVGSVELHPSLTIVYGTPGAQFDRSMLQRRDGDVIGYTHVYPERNVPIPAGGVHKSGIMYPEISLAFRKKFRRLNIEPVIGLKLMRFGAVQSDFSSGRNDRMFGVAPTFAVRAGFRFH